MDFESEKKDMNNTEGSRSSDIPVRKGKGKRGGNSAHSVVVHSGNFREDRGTGKRDDRRLSRAGEHTGEDKDTGRRTSGSGQGDDRGRGTRSHHDRNDGGGRREGGYRGYAKDGRRDGSVPGDRDKRHPADRNSFSGEGFSKRYSGDGTQAREKAPESILSFRYTVKIEKTTDVGAFVKAPEAILRSAYGRKASETGRVLLPFAEQDGRPGEGEYVEVYFYEDKGGRLACTMRTPILRDGELGILRVAASTGIGVFLENNAPKQVLLPFSEQIVKPETGDDVLVWLYTDKSGRTAATMRVYGHLDRNSPYKEDDRVSGFVYEINEKLGIFVAVDNKYYGLVPMGEAFRHYSYGDIIEARVARVREDGKLDLLVRGKLCETVEEDADVILYELKRNNGFLPYGDRADAGFIEETYAMSKNQFKRALGHLYRNRIVELDRDRDTVTLLRK